MRTNARAWPAQARGMHFTSAELLQTNKQWRCLSACGCQDRDCPGKHPVLQSPATLHSANVPVMYPPLAHMISHMFISTPGQPQCHEQALNFSLTLSYFQAAPTATDARVVKQRERVLALRLRAHVQQQHVVRRIVGQDQLAEVHASARVRRACAARIPGSSRSKWSATGAHNDCAQRG